MATPSGSPVDVDFEYSDHSSQSSRWPPNLQYMGTKGSNVLWLDSTRAWGLHHTGEVHTISEQFKNSPRSVQWKEWAKEIQQLVADDKPKPISERIDSVLWLVENLCEPDTLMWQALDGLSPRHLQLCCGFDEECRFEPLEALKHPWTSLRTLSLTNSIDPFLFRKSPKVLSQIRFLSLDYCCLKTDPIPPRAKRLKELHILENNACEMFCYAIDSKRNPCLAKQLKILKINNPGDFYGRSRTIFSPRGFRKRLRKCTNLHELSYQAGTPADGIDRHLAEAIPDSVKKLTLQFGRSIPFLRELDDWIDLYASDSTWLPHLRSFSLAINPSSPVRDVVRTRGGYPWSRDVVYPPGYTNEEFDRQFEVKRRKLYELLKLNRPRLHVLYS